MIRSPYRVLDTGPARARRFTFAVPEDVLAGDDQVAERNDQEVRSPAIDKAINDWNQAKQNGDDAAMHAAARAIVDATSATFKLQGVPTFAHPVLPPQFVKAEAELLRNAPADQRRALVGSFVDTFEPSAKLGAKQQLETGLNHSAATSLLQNKRVPSTLEVPDRGRSSQLEAPFAGPMSNPSFRPMPLDPAGRSAFDTSSPQEGEAKFQKVALPVLLGWAGRERLQKAAKSAGYSVAADMLVTLAANAKRPRNEWKLPSWESLLASALTGAASGVVDLAPGEPWKWEAGIAVLGSLSEDAMANREFNYWAAIGAGVGAGLWEKLGKAAFRNRYGNLEFSQASGKVLSKAIKEIFGAEVELGANELREFMQGFARAVEQSDEVVDYWEKQFDEWFGQGDEDPFL